MIRTGYPVGCSVDGKTGNLAVSNIINNSYGQGNIDVYAKAKGTPKMYTDSGLQKPYFVGYDNKGVLWISGETPSYTSALASMTAKGKFKTGP